MHPAALTLAASLFVAPQGLCPPPPAAPGVSIKSVLRELPGDFRQIATRESAVTASVAGAAALIIGPHDKAIARSAASSDDPSAAVQAGDVLGTAYSQIGAAAGTLFIGRLAHRPTLAATGADLLGAQLVNGAITQMLKYSVRRHRPNGGRRSFPSGHASATFATASVLQRRFGWKVGAPAFAVASYVGVSRLQDNQHYLSDVVVGAAVGIIAGRAVKLHTPMGTYRGAVVPLRGGAVVLLTFVSPR